MRDINHIEVLITAQDLASGDFKDIADKIEKSLQSLGDRAGRNDKDFEKLERRIKAYSESLKRLNDPHSDVARDSKKAALEVQRLRGEYDTIVKSLATFGAKLRDSGKGEPIEAVRRTQRVVNDLADGFLELEQVQLRALHTQHDLVEVQGDLTNRTRAYEGAIRGKTNAGFAHLAQVEREIQIGQQQAAYEQQWADAQLENVERDMIARRQRREAERGFLEVQQRAIEYQQVQESLQRLEIRNQSALNEVMAEGTKRIKQRTSSLKDDIDTLIRWSNSEKKATKDVMRSWSSNRDQFTRDNESLLGSIRRVTGGFLSKLNVMQRSYGEKIKLEVATNRLGRSFRLLFSRMAIVIVGIPALIAAIGTLSVAIYGLIGGVAALLGPLGNLTGLLAGIPSVAAAAAAGFAGFLGVILPGLLGIGKAYEAMQNAKDTLGKIGADAQSPGRKNPDPARTADSGADLAAARVDVARAIEDAERDLTRAQIDGARRVKDAQEDLRRARRDGNAEVKQAQAALREAEIEGVRRVQDAYDRLTEVRLDGAKKIKDAEDDLAQARIDAAFRVKEAQDDLSDTMADNIQETLDLEREHGERRTAIVEEIKEAEEDLADKRIEWREQLSDLEERHKIERRTNLEREVDAEENLRRLKRDTARDEAEIIKDLQELRDKSFDRRIAEEDRLRVIQEENARNELRLQQELAAARAAQAAAGGVSAPAALAARVNAAQAALNAARAAGARRVANQQANIAIPGENAEAEQKRIAELEARLAEAQLRNQEKIADAEQDLNRLRRDNYEDIAKAIKEIADLQNKIREDEEDAINRIADLRAKLNQEDVDFSRESAELKAEHAKQAFDAHEKLNQAITDAAKSVQDAEETLAEARLDNIKDIGDAEDDLAEAIRESDKSIADAQAAFDQAKLNRAEAIGDAQKALDNARLESNRSIFDAEQRLIDARRDGAERIRNAEHALDQARQSSNDAAIRANNLLAFELAKLSPLQILIAEQLFTIKERWLELTEAARNNALLLVLQALALFQRDMPIIAGHFSAFSNTLVSLGQTALLVAQNPFWREIMGRLAVDANTNLGHLGRTFLNLSLALLAVMDAARPFTTWLFQTIEGWSEYILNASVAGNRTGELADYFERTREVLEVLGRIFGDFFITLVNIGSIGRETGMGLLESFAGVVAGWRAFTEDTSEGGGVERIRQFFADTAPLVRILGDLIRAFGREFMEIGSELASNDEFMQSLRSLGEPGGFLDQFGEAIVTLTTEFGPVFIRFLEEMAELFSVIASSGGPLSLFIQGMTSAIGVFNDIPGPIQLLLLNLLGVTLAWHGFLRPMIIFLEKSLIFGPAVRIVMLGLQALASSLITVGAAFLTAIGPIGWIILGVTALVVAIVLLWRKNEWFRTTIISIWNRIKDMFSNVVDAIRGVFEDLHEWLDGWTDLDWIMGKSNNWRERFKELARAAWDALVVVFGQLREWFGVALDELPELTSSAWGAIQEAIPIAWDIILALLRGAWDLLIAFFAIQIAIVIGLILALWDGVLALTRAAWPRIEQFLHDAWNAIQSWFGRQWDQFQRNLSGTWSAIQGAIPAAWGAIQTALTNAWDAIVRWFGTQWTGFLNAIGNLWDGIVRAIPAAWEAVRQALIDAWSTITRWVGGLPTGFRNLVGDIWSAVENAVPRAWSTILTALDTAWGTITTWFGNRVDGFRTLIGNIWSAVAEAVPAAWTTIKNAVSQAWETVRDLFDNVTTVNGFRNLIGHIWSAVEGAIPAAWDAIVNALGRAMAGMINVVIDGIRALTRGFNRIVSEAHLGSVVPDMPTFAGANATYTPGGGVVVNYAEGGFVSAKPGGVYRVAEADYEELVLSTDPRYKSRSLGLVADYLHRMGIPSFARGGYVGGAVPPSGGAIRALASILFKEGFNVSSGYRSTSTTFHGSGEAIDLGDASNNMKKVWEFLFPARQFMAELFGPTAGRVNAHNPTSFKGGGLYHGTTRFSKPSLQATHQDHVHVAVPGGLGATVMAMLRELGSIFHVPFGDFLREWLRDPFRKHRNPDAITGLESGFGDRFYEMVKKAIAYVKRAADRGVENLTTANWAGGPAAGLLHASAQTLWDAFDEGGVVGGNPKMGAAKKIIAHVGEWVLNPMQQEIVGAPFGGADNLRRMLFTNYQPTYSFATGGVVSRAPRLPDRRGLGREVHNHLNVYTTQPDIDIDYVAARLKRRMDRDA